MRLSCTQKAFSPVTGFQRGLGQTMAHNTHLKRMQTLLRPTSFHHVTSSPYYAQSNGEAERAVGTVKGLLKKSADPYLALLAYRSTPLQNGYSPSELLMCRRLHSTVPSTRSQRTLKLPDLGPLREKEERFRKQLKQNYDHHHGVCDLPPLTPGDSEGSVGEEVAPRSYEVTTAEGTYRRNRRHLIRTQNNVTEQRNADNKSADNTSETDPPVEPVRRSSLACQPPERCE